MKILIIHTAFIGDIVLSTPLIRKIKEKYNANIDYLTIKTGSLILQNNPNIDNIIIYDKRGVHKGIKSFFRFVKKLRKEKYDMAIVAHRYFRSNLMAFLSGIPIRIGYDISGGSFLLTKKVKYLKKHHEVIRLLHLIDEHSKGCKLELYPKEKEKQSIDLIWKNNKLHDKKIIVLAPGSKWLTKMWPIDYFNKLIRLLDNIKNLKIVIIGGKDEKKIELISTENVVNLIGKTTLLEVAEILKRGDVLISNDSSPIHIASAFDIFIIAIFGATTKSLGFYPWSKNSIVIENNNIDCRPCGLHGGNKCPNGHFRCMNDIKPEYVFKEILNRL